MDTHFFSQAPAIILEFLKESPDESFKVAEITEACGFAKSNTYKAVHTLEYRGLIEIWRSRPMEIRYKSQRDS